MSDVLKHYGHQVVDADDASAILEALRDEWLTSGPAVARFEDALAAATGARYAVACNSGTAALYLAIRSLGLAPGDTVIVPAITFVATASTAVLSGLNVVFSDVDPETGLMGVEHLNEAIGRAGHSRIGAVCPVHLGGRPIAMLELAQVAKEKNFFVIEDACHALGSESGSATEWHRIGACSHSEAACFSFHPVKTITMGEGGAVTTNSLALAEKMRLLRSHGVSRNEEAFTNRELAFASDGSVNPWYYDVKDISHNFRASDLNCALGASQLRKLPEFVSARDMLMRAYAEKLKKLAPDVTLVRPNTDARVGWHLCTVLIDFGGRAADRATVMRRLRARGIGSQVHYIPVHLLDYYRRLNPGLKLPGAERYYARSLSLPLWPSMTVDDVGTVVQALEESL